MMKLMLLLLAAAAVKATPSSDGTFAVKLKRDQTLHSFSWTVYDQDEDENATLRVCFYWNETGSETAVPSLPFNLAYDNENNGEFSVMSDEPVELEAGVFCGNVAVHPATLSYSTPQVYLVHSEEVSTGAEFIMKISPGTLEAEDLTAANVTRVTGITNYTLQDCTADGDSSCILNPNASPAELCTLSQDISDGGQPVLVCDSSFEVTPVDARTKDTKTVVMYDGDKNTVEVTTTASANSTLHALIRNSSDGNDLISCSGSSCPALASPGTFLYSVVVVEIDDTNSAISSDRVAVQDLELTVVSTDQVIDFHFANMHDHRTYEVFSTNETADDVFDGQPITLDCTGVPALVPCYAFVSSDHLPTYIAVRYSDQTNGVVSKINYE